MRHKSRTEMGETDYDSLAGVFDQGRALSKANELLWSSLFEQHLGFETDSCVLDIGCGDAYISEQLWKTMPLADFSAVDKEFKPDIINRIRARFTDDRITFFQDMEKAYPTRKEHYDIVLLLDVLEHIENESSFLGILVDLDCINKDSVL